MVRPIPAVTAFSPSMPTLIQSTTSLPMLVGGRIAEAALDMTAWTVNAAASTYSRAGLLSTHLASGVREVGVPRRKSERDMGEPPFYLTKRDHFIRSGDGKVDLLLGEISYDRELGSDDSGLIRGDYPAIFFSHGMFMNANFGLFPIDGRGHVPNIDTIRTFLGFFAYLGFRVFYLHMRNCEHIQNRFIRNNSAYVTDARYRPDLEGVKYKIPPDTTFDDLREYDIGSALEHIVDRHGVKNIVAMAHSLGGDMLYDYLGQRRPYAENIVGFVPLCSPLRWSFRDEALIRLLVKINSNADALNSLMENMGSDRKTNPLAFLGERVRIGSELLAGFSPATGFLYELGRRIPGIRDALGTLRYTGDSSEDVDMRTVGKFLRKCLEPMPPEMVRHFMRIVNSPGGHLTSHDGRLISDGFSNIQIPVLAVAGERDGLALRERNIEPDFHKLPNPSNRILSVQSGDHFTTVAGAKAPRATWFKIAEWMHYMGFYPDYNQAALERVYQRYIAPGRIGV